MRLRCFVLLVVPLVLLLAGCGGIKRVPVKGTVTYDGKPIAKGEIRFLPVGEGPVTGSSIVNGVYEATGNSSVVVGKCRVEITATRPLGGKQDPNIPFQQEEQYLPEKYNTRTTLEFDVPAKGPVEKNFDLSR